MFPNKDETTIECFNSFYCLVELSKSHNKFSPTGNYLSMLLKYFELCHDFSSYFASFWCDALIWPWLLLVPARVNNSYEQNAVDISLCTKLCTIFWGVETITHDGSKKLHNMPYFNLLQFSANFGMPWSIDCSNRYGPMKQICPIFSDKRHVSIIRYSTVTFWILFSMDKNNVYSRQYDSLILVAWTGEVDMDYFEYTWASVA